MDLDQRRKTLTGVLEEMSKQEALQALHQKWSSPLIQRAALDRIKQSTDELTAILDELPQKQGSAALDSVLEAHADATLTYVETVVANSRSADMRLAQFQGFRKLRQDHMAQLDTVKNAATPQAALNTAQTLVNTINKATNVLRGVAASPMKYVGALQFWNKFMRPDPGLKRFTLLDKRDLELVGIDDLIFQDKTVAQLEAEQLGVWQVDKVQRALQLTAEDLVIAAKWLGAAVVVLTVTSIVLVTLSDQKHWAEAFVKASFSAGVTVALASVITTTAVNSAIVSAIGSVFGAAAATVEVPPVALFLVATGLVIVIGFAVGELFSFLLDSLFGGDIPPSMRVEMASPMVSSMRSRMAATMASAMS